MKIEIADLSNLYMQITSDAKMWRLVTTPIISRLLGVNFNMIKSDCLGGKCFSEREETIILNFYLYEQLNSFASCISILFPLIL